MGARLSRLAVTLTGFARMAHTGGADASEIRVLSTVVFGEVWHEFQPRFEAAGHKLTLVFGTSGPMAEWVGEGEGGDVGIGTSSGIDRLRREDRVADTVAVLRAKGSEM